MKNFKIPKSFELLDKKISVKMCDRLVSEDDVNGWSEYRLHRIRLQRTNDGVLRPENDIERTFFHELTHWILYQMQNELYSDENFVEGFARLLTQFFKSAKY